MCNLAQLDANTPGVQTPWMPVPKLHYSPIRPRRDRGLVHAVTASCAGVTACDRETAGWVVALDNVLTCKRCIAAIYYPVRPRR